MAIKKSAQSSYYAKIGEPNLGGGKLIQQFGTCTFTTKKKVVTLVTDLKKIVGFSYAYKKGRPPETTQSQLTLMGPSGSVLPSVNCVHIARASAWATASVVWYELVGW